ncbi:hydrogenase expression/formation protein HypE, partial [Candidatus Fermentibacteria bacterium]|nr:hydrogenase expression/formation protein HypE [Candidatus Fermentibacteria bacterium]
MSCPLPADPGRRILMAHGGGGSLTGSLIAAMLDRFGRPAPGDLHDSALLEGCNGTPAFTTDSYVVTPLFFPGGDIGSLAVYGTVNDLAVTGAVPHSLALGFIIEEGFPIDLLMRVADSAAAAARRARVSIVTGDTKVVERGKCDGLYISSSGVGFVPCGIRSNPGSIRDGDLVILSGDIGRHGIAIMAARHGLGLETAIESDAAPLSGILEALLSSGVSPHCMRDLTRGGLASALNEIAAESGMGIEIEEGLVPVLEDVRGACELLGLDPLHVACEGRMVLFADPSEGAAALAAMGSCPEA